MSALDHRGSLKQAMSFRLIVWTQELSECHQVMASAASDPIFMPTGMLSTDRASTRMPKWLAVWRLHGYDRMARLCVSPSDRKNTIPHIFRWAICRCSTLLA